MWNRFLVFLGIRAKRSTQDIFRAVLKSGVYDKRGACRTKEYSGRSAPYMCVALRYAQDRHVITYRERRRALLELRAYMRTLSPNYSEKRPSFNTMSTTLAHAACRGAIPEWYALESGWAFIVDIYYNWD